MLYEVITQTNYSLDIEARGKYKGNIIFENDQAKAGIISLTKQVNILYSQTDKNRLVDTYELGEDEVLVIETFANARNIKAGDTINLKLSGEQYKLRVAGIVLSPEFIYLVSEDTPLLPMPAEYGMVYVSEAFLYKAIGKDFMNEILVKSSLIEKEQLKAIENEIKDINEVLYITSKEETISYTGTEEEIRGEKAMAESLPVVFLFIAAIIRNNFV